MRDVELGYRSLQVTAVRILKAGGAAKPCRTTASRRRVIHGLGENVCAEQLKSSGEALLHTDLQGVIDGIRRRRIGAAKAGELGIGLQQLVVSHRGAGEAAGRIGDSPVERVIDLGVQLRNLVGAGGLHPRAEIVQTTGSTEVKVRSLSAEIVHVHQDVTLELAL